MMQKMLQLVINLDIIHFNNYNKSAGITIKFHKANLLNLQVHLFMP